MNASKTELRSIIAGLLPLAVRLTETDNGSGLPLSEETLDLLERAKLASLATDDGPRIPLDATEAEILEWLNAKADGYDLPGLHFTLSTYRFSPDRPRVLQLIANHKAVRMGFRSAETFDGSVALVRAAIETPETKAARLREEAAKLIREAEEVCPGRPIDTASASAGGSA